MQFYSTNKKSPAVDFREATIKGQPPDKGLYFPESVPKLEPEVVKNIRNYSKEALAIKVLTPYVGSVIPKKELEQMIVASIDFDFPLVQVTERIFSLELFHGPTLAFKDVGARFLSRCLGYFMRHAKQRTIVLVATSGDTGGAVANAFAGVEGVQVVILYPAGKVSLVQELQLVTCGDNVSALQVTGDFDDCQRMVKMAFADTELNESISLTSANSINVARWLPQQVYYFDALRQWKESEWPVFAVPCGNLGNIGAGLLAMKSAGLPIHFIAACNANKSMHDYLTKGIFLPAETIPTISNAMDVGAPSNFSRILELFEHGLAAIRKTMSSASISDESTKKQIADVNAGTGYILDPHGAVGMQALEQHLSSAGGKGIFLETAHPLKFADVVEPLINTKVPVPPAIAALHKAKKKITKLGIAYPELKSFLMEMEKK